ncbi:MAG: hypothetical protein K2W95_23425 [Candidatus Obscuribacterales bacterium]|nr:hypothetical protein [Candidatus Obscuribacterales bacterium]
MSNSSAPRFWLPEDHPVNQQVMRLMLTNLAVEFQVVNNGLEAVTVIENDDGASDSDKWLLSALLSKMAAKNKIGPKWSKFMHRWGWTLHVCATC